MSESFSGPPPPQGEILPQVEGMTPKHNAQHADLASIVTSPELLAAMPESDVTALGELMELGIIAAHTVVDNGVEHEDNEEIDLGVLGRGRWTLADMDHLKDDKAFLRLVNPKGFLDLKEKGIVRSSPTGTAPNILPGGINIGGRPTSFPAFAKGEVDVGYLNPNDPHTYALKHPGPMVMRGELNPVTGKEIRGRHWGYRQIDSSGHVVTEIPHQELSGVYRISQAGDVHRLEITKPPVDAGNARPVEAQSPSA
jgi:hypothetical protein